MTKKLTIVPQRLCPNPSQTKGRRAVKGINFNIEKNRDRLGVELLIKNIDRAYRDAKCSFYIFST